MKLKSIATILSLLLFFPLSGNANPPHNTDFSPAWVQKILKNSDTKLEISDAASKHKVGLLKLEDEVDSTMAEGLISGIEKLNEAGVESIVMEINTPGGSVHAGFRIARAMESSKATIYCVVDQDAVSMGYYILQSCDVRLMTKRSQLMIHAPLVVNFSMTGDESEFAKVFLQLHVLTEAMIEQFSYRTNVSTDEMRQKISHSAQWWVNWEEALSRGMVDGIVRNSNVVMKQLSEHGKLR